MSRLHRYTVEVYRPAYPGRGVHLRVHDGSFESNRDFLSPSAAYVLEFDAPSSRHAKQEMLWSIPIGVAQAIPKSQRRGLSLAGRISLRSNPRLTLAEFIKEHRAEIDAAILRVVGSLPYKNDAERRLWVLNDEGLYRWARSEGVRI